MDEARRTLADRYPPEDREGRARDLNEAALRWWVTRSLDAAYRHVCDERLPRVLLELLPEE